MAFVVAGEASVVHEPADVALDGPPFPDDRESAGAGRALDGVDVDTEAGSVVDGGGAVARVHPGLRDVRVGGGNAGQQGHAGCGVADAGGIHLLSRIANANPHVTKAWTDTGYRTKVIEHGARLGIDVHVVQRDPAVKGFKVIPRRWVVERAFGRLMHHRRLARDHESHPHRSEAMIRIAMIGLISRRLTRESTLNWRDT